MLPMAILLISPCYHNVLYTINLCRKTAEPPPSIEEEPNIIKASPSIEGQVKDAAAGSLRPPRFEGEKDLSVRAKLAGVEVTLADRRGELLTADTKGEYTVPGKCP
jgi:hypothetical protein